MPAPEWVPRAPDDILAGVKARGAQLRFRRRSRFLSGCIAVLAVTALVAAGARDLGGITSLVADDPSGATTTSDPEPTSTTVDDDAVGDADGDDHGEPSSTTTTTERGSSAVTSTTIEPATAEAVSTTTTAAPAVRGAFDSPKPGTYRYRVELDGSESERRLTYAELGRENGETRLSERWDDPGIRPTKLLWSDGGVVVPNDDSCDEEGFKTRYVFPLAVGATWSSEATCSNGERGRIHTRSSARVTDFVKVTVAGQTVDAWVISSRGTTEITLAGVKQTFHGETTEWFSAAHGLRVKSVIQAQAEPGGDSPRGPSRSEILNLEPE